jgi:hypothetical protein
MIAALTREAQLMVSIPEFRHLFFTGKGGACLYAFPVNAWLAGL